MPSKPLIPVGHCQWMRRSWQGDRENSVPVMAMQARNDFGEVEYDGPKPPSGEHRYYFRAFALDTMLPLTRGSKRQDFDREAKGHVLETATLVGKFAR